MPISWKGTLAQYVGRLHRDHIDKGEVVVYDYIDAGVSVLARMAARRQSGYRALGYRVRANPPVADVPTASAISAVADARRPSDVIDSYWIHAEREHRSAYPHHSGRGGTVVEEQGCNADRPCGEAGHTTRRTAGGYDRHCANSALRGRFHTRRHRHGGPQVLAARRRSYQSAL